MTRHRESAAGSSFWQHPLLGSGTRALLAGVRDGGGVSVSRLPDLTAAVGSSVMRWPARILQKAIVRRRLARLGEPPPPIFLIGHWRSGTTHAYNVLSHDPQFIFPDPLAAGLPGEFMVMERFLRPHMSRLLPGDRWVDALAVNPDSPQEDEIALANLQPLSFVHAAYFPRRFRELLLRGVFFDGCSEAEIEGWKGSLRDYLRALWLARGEGTLLVKNPAHTARIGILRDLYPDARFIHLRRNPYDVFRSTLRFWRTMIDQFAWQDPRSVTDEVVEEVVLEVYARMMGKLLEARDHLPANRFVEVGLEEMEDAPLATVEQIYQTLEIDGLPKARPSLDRYLRSIQSYRKRSYTPDPRHVSMIQSRWAPFIEAWDYEVPA
ncbi:MAG: sulfotransferase [Longimicrobiales bacterium]|nr:sulfotransferase [Longimicrobiales bacterium]